MKRGAVALAVALASLACTCGDSPPADGLLVDDLPDLPFADPDDDPVAGPREGRGGRGGRGGRQRGGERPPPTPGDPSEPPEEPSPEPAPVPGITYKGDDTWEVERRLVDRYEADPDRLGARVEEHGRGWEVRGVGEEDDAWALGARNGDVIRRINGMPLDTTTDLLLVWSELGDARKLDVQLTRDGEPRVHHYHVVR